jgi:repressor LexA
MVQLTDRHRQILELISTVVAERGYPPSVREIGEAVGLSSPSTVHSHLSTLVKAGMIRKDPSKPRAIEVLAKTKTARSSDRVREVPILGRVAAGAPLLAVEDVDEVMPLPTALVGSGPVFMLRVKGESMVGAGILDGDLVVVRRQPDATDGEIVAALVNGEEATIKRLLRKHGRVVLTSENPDFPPMLFDRDVQIIGKVVAVIRKVS